MYHSMRDWVEEGLIELCKVDTCFNAANKMSKNFGPCQRSLSVYVNVNVFKHIFVLCFELYKELK